MVVFVMKNKPVINNEQSVKADESIKKHKRMLVAEFVKNIAALPGKRKGKELMTLHRIFPHEARKMFRLWLKSSEYKDDGHLFKNLDEFGNLFEAALRRHGVKVIYFMSTSSYNKEHGDYKYKFSSFRLTKAGMQLYILILPDDDLESA
jgi:hypothetical protein